VGPGRGGSHTSLYRELPHIKALPEEK